MNTQPLFEIEEIFKKKNNLDVEIIFKDGEQKTITVSRNEFEQWLDDSDRLNWETNSSDHTGEHVQTSGKYLIYQYWEECADYHSKDMYDFLLVSKIGFERLMQGVYDGIESICKEYEN